MTQADREELARKIDVGIKTSVADALEEHRRMGRSIVIWRGGKIMNIPAEEIPPRHTTDVGQDQAA